MTGLPEVTPQNRLSTTLSRSPLLVHHSIQEILLRHMSPKPVWGQCDKRMLVGALCPVQIGYDMALFGRHSRKPTLLFTRHSTDEGLLLTWCVLPPAAALLRWSVPPSESSSENSELIYRQSEQF